jgi:hypothetical protein
MRPNQMNEWLDFTGHYDKHECDVMLKDGTVIEYCWPNNGFFTKVKDSKTMIYFKDVNKVRYHDYFKILKGKFNK